MAACDNEEDVDVNDCHAEDGKCDCGGSGFHADDEKAASSSEVASSNEVASYSGVASSNEASSSVVVLGIPQSHHPPSCDCGLRPSYKQWNRFYEQSHESSDTQPLERISSCRNCGGSPSFHEKYT
jgi:hypothetical protein